MASIFESDEFKPLAADWAERQLHLAYRQAYYDGTIYKSVRDRFTALGALSPMLGPRLYRGTKALFLMLSRAVDVDAGIVPGGWKLAEDAPQAWAGAMKQILQWSDWEREGPLYVHYGATYGVVGLKVADLRDAQRVVIGVLDPTTFMLVESPGYSRAPSMAIIVEERCEAGADQDYEYAEVITPEEVRTFKNGQPEGFDGRPDRYPNDQAAVPVVQVRHIHTGDELGEATAQKVFPLLDEINELASYLADIIRKHAEAQWAVIGAEPGDLVKSGDNIWFVPAGGDIKAAVAGIDIAGVLSFITTIRDEIQNGLPELAFAELKDKTQIATATLEIQLMELVLKIKRVRPNYDHGLCDGLRLAGRAAKSMGLADLGALDDEALALDSERPVLPLDKLTQIQVEQAQINLDKAKAPPTQPPPGSIPQPMPDPTLTPPTGGSL